MKQRSIPCLKAKQNRFCYSCSCCEVAYSALIPSKLISLLDRVGMNKDSRTWL